MKVKNVSLENKVILVTGAAGFIGSNLVMELLREVHPVHIVGIDNMNEYYDVSIKEYRLNQIEELVGKQEGSTWKFIKGSIADKVLINQIFAEDKPAVVVNLAAQAGDVLNLHVNFHSQLASKDLDGSEQFVLGGAFRVCGGNTVKLQYTAIKSNIINTQGKKSCSIFLSPYSSLALSANAE